MCVLKMIIQDNFIHADLHPGNVLVRPTKPLNEYPFWERAKRRFFTRVLGLGNHDDIPEIIFLDAGLSATLEPHLQPYVQDFFIAMLQYDGKSLAEAILKLSEQHVKLAGTPLEAQQAFINQMAKAGREWKRIRDDPEMYREARQGDAMRDALDCCRENGIELHPTVLVAVVSCMTLEGWQFELAPTVSIMDHTSLLLSRREKFDKFLDTTLHENLYMRAYETANLIEDGVSALSTHDLQELFPSYAELRKETWQRYKDLAGE